MEQEEVQGKRIAQLARKAGVQHFVYASVGSAMRQTGIPHFDSKAKVEDTVRSLGFPSFVVLRPAFFMENLSSPWFKPGIDKGTLAVGMSPLIPLQMIAVADIGKYGRMAFERHVELNGEGLEMAGDAVTMPQAAEILSKVTGRTVTHFQVPIEDVRKFSEDLALMLEWFDRVGYNADIAGNEARYGIKPTTFTQWAATADWSVPQPAGAGV